MSYFAELPGRRLWLLPFLSYRHRDHFLAKWCVTDWA